MSAVEEFRHTLRTLLDDVHDLKSRALTVDKHIQSLRKDVDRLGAHAIIIPPNKPKEQS